jgi:hypothetical protein
LLLYVVVTVTIAVVIDMLLLYVVVTVTIAVVIDNVRWGSGGTYAVVTVAMPMAVDNVWGDKQLLRWRC